MATKLLYLDGITNNEENRALSNETGLHTKFTFLVQACSGLNELVISSIYKKRKAIRMDGFTH